MLAQRFSYVCFDDKKKYIVKWTNDFKSSKVLDLNEKIKRKFKVHLKMIQIT